MSLFLLIVLMLVLSVPLAVPGVRRILITPRLLDLFKRVLPSMSATERDALEAGRCLNTSRGAATGIKTCASSQC